MAVLTADSEDIGAAPPVAEDIAAASSEQPVSRSGLTSYGIGHFIPPGEDLSLADLLAGSPLHVREEMLAGIDQQALLSSFEFWGRPSQIEAIFSPAPVVACLAGRGWGKTRALAEWVIRKAREMPGSRGALIGRVTSDVRDILILGESGILACSPPDFMPEYKPAIRRLVWPNGSEAMTFSADIPDQLRGPQFHWAACDELGSWRAKPSPGSSGLLTAWDNVKIATRLGSTPQIFVATTPRRVPMIMDLIKLAEEGKCHLVRGSTYANRMLAGTYMDTVRGMYEGTRMGAQELNGEILGDSEGALLGFDTIERNRLHPLPVGVTDYARLPLRIVGVDPSVAERPTDECGIVVIGASAEREVYRRHGWVLEDASILGSPQVWAKQVISVAKKWGAVVVAEANQGGELVKMVLQAEDASVPVTLVHATQGKTIRAEPVVMAYEQGRVHHTEYFSLLETQLTTWVPSETKKSPDRLDALVWALTSAMVKTPAKWVGNVRPGLNPARVSIMLDQRDRMSGTVVPGLRAAPPSTGAPIATSALQQKIAAARRRAGHAQTYNGPRPFSFRA